MAFENLFIRTRRAIEGVELDAVLVERHLNDVLVTENPIELGADISDHAEIQPKKLEITGVVSDTPLGVAAFGQIVDTVTGFFGSATTQNLTRSVAAYNALVLLMETREPVQVQTRLRLYNNMLITAISVDQDKDSSRAAFMRIFLKEVRLVQSQVIQIEADDLQEGSPREQASAIDSEGRQEAVEPAPTVQTSVLKTISDWVSG